MADDKKWVTINGAHVPIEDGKPQFGGDKKKARREAVTRLRQLVENKQGRQSNFGDDNSDLETVEVDLTADIQKQFDNAKTSKERQKIAFRYIMDNLCGEYSTKDGRAVTISSIGADKITHRDIEIKLRVSPHLAEFIKAGELRGVKDVIHKKFDKFAYYKVKFQFKKDCYIALLNIGIRADGTSTLYDINPFNKQ